mgnify:CR=1 FL=1|jgi:hypothetical protein
MSKNHASVTSGYINDVTARKTSYIKVLSAVFDKIFKKVM